MTLYELYYNLSEMYLNPIKEFVNDKYGIELDEIIKMGEALYKPYANEIKELSEDNSISALEEYYEIIDTIMEIKSSR